MTHQTQRDYKRGLFKSQCAEPYLFIEMHVNGTQNDT